MSEILRPSCSGGSVRPYNAGDVSWSSSYVSPDSSRLRHTVVAKPADGYRFVKWELEIPQLWDGAEFDAAAMAAIRSQLNSQTITWDDPVYYDGGMGIGFIAYMELGSDGAGDILYGKSEVPIYGKNGSILYKG